MLLISFQTAKIQLLFCLLIKKCCSLSFFMNKEVLCGGENEVYAKAEVVAQHVAKQADGDA